jgi:hypothetical protein
VTSRWRRSCRGDAGGIGEELIVGRMGGGWGDGSGSKVDILDGKRWMLSVYGWKIVVAKKAMSGLKTAAYAARKRWPRQRADSNHHHPSPCRPSVFHHALCTCLSRTKRSLLVAAVAVQGVGAKRREETSAKRRSCASRIRRLVHHPCSLGRTQEITTSPSSTSKYLS